LAGALALITVNSGEGRKAMLRRLPIHCCGAADSAPVVHSVHTEAEPRAKTEVLWPDCCRTRISGFAGITEMTISQSGE
jgi:hypothetical protein